MRVFSGPMPASESAASTFTLAGNARHASVAGPSKMSVSVVIRSRSIFCCSIHGAPARPRGGLRVSIVPPGIPSSSARQTARPIAPRPAMPTFMVTHVIMPAGGGMTSARTLREPLEHLYRDFDYTARVEFDAIRFPLRYAEPRDRELVGLLAACLAYGRVDLFGRQLDTVPAAMGPSPAAFVQGFDPARDAPAFARFWYRFILPRDLVAFCVAARDLLGPRGTPR